LKKIKYKATAKSPANIAFIKFWGKRNPKLNIPFNDSLSMNLSDCLTTTTVEFNPRFRSDRVFIDGKEVVDEKRLRVLRIVDLVRERANISWGVKIKSENSFPSDAGIASSASGFSALALAASSAAGLDLSLKELSILARLGSGSASRSVINGFAEWKKGKNNNTSYAVQIAPSDFWDLRDIVVVVGADKKKKSSTEGHAVALTSPFFKTRQFYIPKRIREIKIAILKKNFKRFGELLEQEAIELHMIAMTSVPPVYYWNKGTVEAMNKVRELREKGILAYFTMDAGPNVHIICLSKDALKVRRKINRLPEVLFTIINKPCEGSQRINKDLF
jgi:diphosphomevalonate decarboxylase